jgi:hypothetical protein
MKTDQRPQFDFEVPRGYLWLLERDLVSFEPFGKLQPWYYMDAASAFSPTTRWPNGPASARLESFARRQDNDELACFEIAEDGAAGGVVVINGWTPAGYDVLSRHSDFWQWLKTVIDDIAEWSELPDDG